MDAIDDSELLRCYAEERSESAFAEIVRRRANFVYSCALRRVGGDAHLAHDVTQLEVIRALPPNPTFATLPMTNPEQSNFLRALSLLCY